MVTAFAKHLVWGVSGDAVQPVLSDESSRQPSIAAALVVGGCANQQKDLQAGLGAATPGSPQEFQVSVGDRVFFETDSSSLTAQSQATLGRQVQWLQQYSQYTFTIGVTPTSAARASTTSRSAPAAPPRSATS